jgi:long-chain acyl-CoA synthetase
LKYGAPYAYPRRVYFLDSMPLGGTGKIDRAQLEKLAAEFEEKVQHEPA